MGIKLFHPDPTTFWPWFSAGRSPYRRDFRVRSTAEILSSWGSALVLRMVVLYRGSFVSSVWTACKVWNMCLPRSLPVREYWRGGSYLLRCQDPNDWWGLFKPVDLFPSIDSAVNGQLMDRGNFIGSCSEWVWWDLPAKYFKDPKGIVGFENAWLEGFLQTSLLIIK